MGLIRFPSPRVDDPKKAVIGFLIDNDVIDDSTLIVEEKTVKGASDLHFGKVIGEGILGKFISLGTVDPKTAHVGNIEKPGAVTGGLMLEEDALGVGNGHVPAVEIHQLRPVFLVPFEAKSISH